MTAQAERIEELEALVEYLQQEVARVERNRDMWRSQCQHQADALASIRQKWCADVTHPDMRLIAAAPDLLEALRTIVKSLSDQDDEGMIEHAEPMIRARAAIQKATKEQV